MVNNPALQTGTTISFPNMTAGVVEEERNCIVVEMGSSNQFKESPAYQCYHCSEIVPESKVHKHLFLAPAICISCSCSFKTCKDYARSKSKGFSNGCQHKFLEFEKSSKVILNMVLNGTKVPFADHFYCDNCNKRRYLQTLTPLKSNRPWGSVISLGENLECSCPQTLKDGRFLVSKKPLEECPDCYSSVDIKRCTCNLQSWIVLYECSVCELPIYFLLDPPDGRPPRAVVAEDKESVVNTKSKYKAVNGKSKKIDCHEKINDYLKNKVNP